MPRESWVKLPLEVTPSPSERWMKGRGRTMRDTACEGRRSFMTGLKSTMFICMICLLLVSVPLAMGQAQQADQLIAGIPVKVKSERHWSSDRFVELALPKQY